jgi:hypothetical protein
LATDQTWSKEIIKIEGQDPTSEMSESEYLLWKVFLKAILSPKKVVHKIHKVLLLVVKDIKRKRRG